MILTVRVGWVRAGSAYICGAHDVEFRDSKEAMNHAQRYGEGIMRYDVRRGEIEFTWHHFLLHEMPVTGLEPEPAGG